MKKLLSLALYAALFSLTIACGSDPEEFQPAPTGKTPIALQATLADYGRATDTLFEEGDQIGLYIFTSETYIDNGLYTIKEGALQSNGARYWYEDKTIESTLVAYYPYASAWKYNAEGVTFTVREDQTSHKAYSASDLMVATTTAKPTSEAVTLPFRHALSKVILKINNQLGEAIREVSISNVLGSVKVDQKNLSVAATGNMMAIKAAPVTIDDAEGWQLIVAPQQGADPMLTVTTASGKQYSCRLEERTDLAACKQHTAHATLTAKEGLKLTLSYSIEDWEEGENIDFVEDEDPSEEPEPTPTPGEDVADGYSYIFDMEALPEIHLNISEKEWNDLLKLYDQNSNTDEYIHCDASFIKEGKIHSFTDTGLRLRGNTSRRRPEGNGGEMHNTENPDYHHVHFMLNLRKFQKDDEHELGGVRKIHLKWHKDDPCYAREIFCYDLFRRYGIWTALNTSYCRLWLKVGDSKEAYYGVYIMLESPDERYLKKRIDGFEDDKGFLWKCGWSNSGFGAGLDSTNDDRFWHDDNAGTENRAYCLKTEIESFDAAKAQIKDFIKKLNGKSGDDFKNWISSVTDVELLLKTYAVNVAVGMWDDYWCNQNNYYIYFNSMDKENYKFFFIPYDYDNTLGTSSMIDAGRQNPLNWDNSDSGRQLIEKLLQYSDYKKIYLDALKEICSNDNLMKPAAATARIKGWHAMIGDYVSNDTGEDMKIKDRPAGWSNKGEYRLLESGSNNFFEAKAASIPQN